jgi:hypothetical protein
METLQITFVIIALGKVGHHAECSQGRRIPIAGADVILGLLLPSELCREPSRHLWFPFCSSTFSFVLSGKLLLSIFFHAEPR